MWDNRITEFFLISAILLRYLGVSLTYICLKDSFFPQILTPKDLAPLTVLLIVVTVLYLSRIYGDCDCWHPDSN